MEDKIRESLNIAPLIKEYLYNQNTEIPFELQQWIKHSEQNKKLFNEITAGKGVLSKIEWYDSVDTTQAWEIFDERRKALKKAKQKRIWRWVGGVAASLLLPALCFQLITTKISLSNSQAYVVLNGEVIQPGKMVATLQIGDKDIVLDETMSIYTKEGISIVDSTGTALYENELEHLARISTLRVPRGGEYFITLEDGTKVWLNSDSKLCFPECFDTDQRIVSIEGEAYMEIAKNSSHPFYVELGETKIHVTGTAFNIRHYKDETEMKVTLVEGGIQMEDRNETILAQLAPKQQFCMHNEHKTFTVEEVALDEVLGWKQGVFLFNNRSLTEIAKSLERWYNLDIEVDSTLLNARYSGELDRYETIEPLLRILRRSNELEIVQTHKQGVRIVPAAKE